MLCRARSEADAARRFRPPEADAARRFSSAESDGAREFPRQCVDLLFRLLGALDLSELLRLFQFFSQLRKPLPVGDLGLLVEHLARVTQTSDMDPSLFEILIPARQTMRGLTGFVIIVLACDSSRQIEHVKFGRGMTQQMGEVAEPLSVL